ncbi:MAG: hypothetical protein ACKOXB_08860 [Flavobacteriales bacterium]
MMKEKDFARLVIEAKMNDANVLHEYFLSYFMKAKEEHVSPNFFFVSLNNVIELLIEKIKYYAEKDNIKKDLANHMVQLIYLSRGYYEPGENDHMYLVKQTFTIKELEHIRTLILSVQEAVSEDAPLFDTDDQNPPTVIEKIIIMKELGVLDFLRESPPFSTSTNRLADALALVLDENSGTIQSYLNPMYGRSVSKKNDPYSSKKAVAKAKFKLAALGIQ